MLTTQEDVPVPEPTADAKVESGAIPDPASERRALEQRLEETIDALRDRTAERDAIAEGATARLIDDIRRWLREYQPRPYQDWSEHVEALEAVLKRHDTT